MKVDTWNKMYIYYDKDSCINLYIKIYKEMVLARINQLYKIGKYS